MRPAFTLVEVIVVLVLLGLSAGLAAPAVARLARQAPAETRADAVETARRYAVRRGQALELRIGADGGWQVIADSGGMDTELARGTATDVAAAERLAVSALGSCMPTPLPARGWDPVRCAAGDTVVTAPR